MSDVRCYAIRRVNPFQGITQIVERESSRALTADGINWELQLAADRPSGWGSLNRNTTERSYVRYGVWSEQEGLARFPANPQLDAQALRSEGEALLEAVQSHRSRLPFPPGDDYERWLLDNLTREPIALLATASEDRFAVPMRGAQWQAALGQSREFESASLTDAGLTRQGQPRRHLDYLERTLNKRGRGAEWFRREESGSGVSLDGTQSWPGEDFPPLPWTEHWQGEEVGAFADYTALHAPRLLMLNLPLAMRDRLEALAKTQPAQVDRLYPLYPEVADAERMRQIRVMGRLFASG
ncbi:MAG: hypothetical protein WBX11_09165 [Thiobacillaceae bacterium]